MNSTFTTNSTPNSASANASNSTEGKNVHDLLRLAKEDLMRNSFSSAERTLEQAILMNNQVAEGYHLLGYTYSKRGKFKKAILAYERAIALDPNHTEAAIALSSLYNDVGKYREGAEIFQRNKARLQRTQPGHDPRINKDLSKFHFDLGMTYMRYERFQEAQHEFAKARNLEPENMNTWVQMAKCLSKIGDKNGAVELLRKALEINPKNVIAKIQMGILLHALGRLKEAGREWTESLQIEPENATAKMYLRTLETAKPILGNS